MLHVAELPAIRYCIQGTFFCLSFQVSAAYVVVVVVLPIQQEGSSP